MNLARIATIVRKDVAKGPRSPFFLWVLVLPLLLSGIFHLVFGAFLDTAPVLGVVAPDDSAVLAALKDRSGLRVVRVNDAETLWKKVDSGEVELGWVVPPGFEAALRAGQRPALDIALGGETLASHRFLLALATTETVRGVTGEAPPVQVEVIGAGDIAERSLLERLLPLVVLLTILVGGIFLPAFGLIDEKEKGALAALLVTPTTMGEILVAKGALGFVLAIAAGAFTLAINGAFPSDPVPILVVFVVAAVMTVELGLLLGALVKSTTMMFTIWKGTAWILILPVVTFVWSGFPRWLAMASPTWWFIHPVWKIAVEGKGLADAAGELAVAAAICAALFPVVVWAGRRAARGVGAG